MKRAAVLRIIKEYRLDHRYVGRMARVAGDTVRCYVQSERLFMRKDELIEEAVLEWHAKMIKNRRRLLEFTPYAHLYQEEIEIMKFS